IQWNGSKIGVMWVELLRGPNGELHSPYRFALLDASGNVLRNDVRIGVADGVSSQNSEPQFLWDGSAWSFVESHEVPAGGSDLMLYRFDEDGDLLAGPVNLINDAESDFAHALAWNGSEYGIAWVRGNGANQHARFQRFSSSGVPLGAPVTINDFVLVSVPDVVAAPDGGWAVTWSESEDDTEAPAMMRRFDGAGNALGAATRLSEPMTTFQVADFIYDTIALPSGFAVLTRGFTSIANEVGFIRTDAAGNRIGARAIVSPQDAFASAAGHFAHDGTHFLVTFNEGRLGTQEIASAVVDANGAFVAGPTDLTSGHSPGNGLGIVTSTNPHVTPLGGGFVATWNESVPGDTKLYAKIVDASGAVGVTKFPLTPRGIRGRAGVAAVGSTFAVAFRDATNAIAFCRYDASGNPLMSETTPVAGVNAPGVVLGFDGESYGLLWVQGLRMQFQRVAPDGTALGARSTLPPQLDANNAPLQMTWTGAGWAIVYVAGNDVHSMLIDAAGAVIVGPVRVSFTPDDTKNTLAAAWNGDALGIAYASLGTSGPRVRFTAVGLDGVKLFDEITVTEGAFGTMLQGLVWANDRFRLFHQPTSLGTMRELDFSAAGAQLGAARTITNRGGNASVAWN
ncbi:MAG TPA: hypothetical protein VHK90_14910, partial [Thermoanaerobaculia bacterium]|nr:hypothetical protein [Thermoanaerobaculia bacterium]